MNRTNFSSLLRHAVRIVPILVALGGTLCANALAGELKDGDLIFQTSHSPQSRAIQLATSSPYSHMGIVIHRNGNPFVYEAGATVGYTPLAEWIARGENGRYVVKRLKNADRLLTGESLSKLRRVAEEFHHKPYDPYFAWSDRQIYCSELVWKIYQRTLGLEIGRPQKLKAFDLTSKTVRTQLRQRYGKKIPYNERVISPAAMFNSRLLVPVTTE